MTEKLKHNAIICAANRNRDGRIIKGFRHFDSHMHHKFKFYNLNSLDFTEQGFIDMYNNFVSREEALKIVIENGQYVTGKLLNQLYSEDIYD